MLAMYWGMGENLLKSAVGPSIAIFYENGSTKLRKLNIGLREKFLQSGDDAAIGFFIANSHA